MVSWKCAQWVQVIEAYSMMRTGAFSSPSDLSPSGPATLSSSLVTASALPVQIFLWSDSAEVAWEERTSAAILILLVFMIGINGVAIWLRSRLEKRW